MVFSRLRVHGNEKCNKEECEYQPSFHTSGRYEVSDHVFKGPRKPIHCSLTEQGSFSGFSQLTEGPAIFMAQLYTFSLKKKRYNLLRF